MTKSFEFESDYARSRGTADRCARLEVSIYIECRDRDGCDATFEIESIENLESGEILDVAALPEAEQVRIEHAADALACEYANEAYQSYAEGAADAMYDAWKDGTYD